MWKRRRAKKEQKYEIHGKDKIDKKAENISSRRN